jgi:hypothetical protein
MGRCECGCAATCTVFWWGTLIQYCEACAARWMLVHAVQAQAHRFESGLPELLPRLVSL